MLHSATSNYVATSAEHGLGNISTLGTTAAKDTFLTQVLANIFSVAWVRSDVYTQSPVGKSTTDLALLP